MKRKFIINPHSGTRMTVKAVAELERFFTRKIGSFDYMMATSRDAALQTTRQSLKQGLDQIVAVGGDGTVNAVVNGFFENGRPIRPESSLAIANTGTGSDYFKAVVAGKSDPGWKELVLDHTLRSVDVGCIHYADATLCDQYFVNMASVGMIAEVVKKKDRNPGWVPPRFRYFMPAVSSLLAYRPKPVQVTVDAESFDLELLAISICKGTCAGGGMRFGGEVTLFDGLFDITLFRAMNPVKRLVKIRKLYTGSFKDEPEIQKFRARYISIAAPLPLPVEFDGERYGTTDIEVSVEPKSLPVCFPKE